MRKVLYSFLALVLICAMCPVVAFCQETATQKPAVPAVPEEPGEEIPAGEEVSYSYGTVAAVTATTITINEISYNEQTGEETTASVEFSIDPKVELENVASVQEIQAGKDVDIEYVEAEGKKLAKYIYVYE